MEESIFSANATGLSESFEVDGLVVKVSSQSRDILFKKTPSIKKWQAEWLADTNQVGGDFCRQPSTFDNPVLTYLHWP